MNIGEKIKQLRTKRNMTQERLAQYLNVTVSAVSQWESGKTMPDVTMLVPICNLFSVSADSLLNINLTEKDTVIAEIKNEVFSLAAKGEYDNAITLIKDKMKEYPDEVEIAVTFAQLVMDFDKNVDGRSEDKNALINDVHEHVIKSHALDEWKNKESYDRELDTSIIMLVARALITNKVAENTRKLRAKIDSLLTSDDTETIKAELVKIVYDHREIGGTAMTQMGYESLTHLMRLNWNDYQTSHNKSLLPEIIKYGDEFLSCNSPLELYFATLHYLITASKAMGNSADKYIAILVSAKTQIDNELCDI